MLPYHLQHKSRSAGTYGGARKANGLVVRGVVLKTYLPDDAVILKTGKKPAGVTCDVLVYEQRQRVILKRVPVSPSSAGLNDHEVWIPEASTFDTSTGSIYNLDYLVGAPISKVQDLDGDHVRIEFLGGDLNQPMITGAIPHPKSKRAPSIASLTQYKYQRFLRGMSFAVTQDGDVELDLSAPTTKPSEGGTLPDGTEVPNPLGGNLTVIFQPGALLQFIDSTTSAPDSVIKGDTYLTDESTLLTAWQTFLAALTTYIAGIKPIADPTNVLTPVMTAAITAINSSLTTRNGQITTSLTPARLPYLSTHVKID